MFNIIFTKNRRIILQDNNLAQNSKNEVNPHYISKFAEYLKKGATSKIIYLLKELLTHIKAVCLECESDRIRCILKPMCGKSRPYLSIRLELGYRIEELPQFCLKQHLNYFSNFLKGKVKGRVFKDVKITISQLLMVLDEIKPLSIYIPPLDQNEEIFKIILNIVKTIIPEAEIYPGNEHSYISVFGTLIHINLKSGMVNLNPSDEPITSPDELKKLIEIYSKIYNIKVDIIEEIYGFWYLDFFIKKIESEKSLEKKEMDMLRAARRKLEAHSNYATFSIIEDELHCIVDIPAPGKNDVIKMLDPELINTFFKIIKDYLGILKKSVEKNS